MPPADTFEPAFRGRCDEIRLPVAVQRSHERILRELVRPPNQDARVGHREARRRHARRERRQEALRLQGGRQVRRVRECAGVSVCVRATCTRVSACVRPCSVHVFHRATNGDYRGSGLDRGHMAAAANHKWSQKAMDDTFYLTNVAPQNPHMNQNAWNNLEKLCRSLTKLYANVYVCTGPLYLPRQEADGKLYVHYQVLGPNHIAVPTHFFKVLVLERDGTQGGVELRSYVLPNEPVDEKIPLERFLVPIETIERASGLLFLPNILRTSGGAVTAAANK
ncbi:endonuclease G, mitochondrial isoform X2 [Phyllopteryx taeniolatus]|uniref:endonuclease G, mitochondrial isoform X2 n=1 Tax=Phyllopteryx taeniolatus TaxID=161469 RepID=UPI002AD25237|nr:endonuclease G, mitochondrial isoform X2 [Phyllopteryx taeniolatus]